MALSTKRKLVCRLNLWRNGSLYTQRLVASWQGCLGTAWSFIGTMTAAPKRLTLSGIIYAASTPCYEWPVHLASSGRSSLLLDSVTQDLFFLLVVNGVLVIGCRSLRTFPAHSQRCACIMKLERCLPL